MQLRVTLTETALWLAALRVDFQTSESATNLRFSLFSRHGFTRNLEGEDAG